MKKLIILTILILTGMANLACAQILIEQGKLRIEAKPGATLTGIVAVHNTSDKPLDLKAYWEDFIYVPPYDGTKKFSPGGSSNYSLKEWISFSPTDFSLPPFAKKNINYTIRVPSNVDGGHYGVLFVEQKAGTVQGMAGIQIVARVGSLFFVEPPKKNKAVAITNISFRQNTLTGDFTNQGNIFLIPKGIYYILGQDAMVIDRRELDKSYLSPNSKAPFALKIPPKLPAGRYTSVITFDLEDGDSKVVEIDFTKDASGKFILNKVQN